jgi:hypothetical protein
MKGMKLKDRFMFSLRLEPHQYDLRNVPSSSGGEILLAETSVLLSMRVSSVSI